MNKAFEEIVKTEARSAKQHVLAQLSDLTGIVQGIRHDIVLEDDLDMVLADLKRAGDMLAFIRLNVRGYGREW